MLTVRPSVPEDVPAQRELWKLAFGDSDAYIDNFYNTYYRPGRVVVLEEDGVLRSMTAWFDTSFVVPGQGEYRAAYLYAVATHPGCRGRGFAARLLAGADDCFRSLDIPAVTTVPAEPSLHRFFGSNGFRECFCTLSGILSREEILSPPSNVLRPAPPEEYGRVREKLLAGIPHIAYPADALAYQAGCCAPGGGGLFTGGPAGELLCLCAERADEELVIVKELLGSSRARRTACLDLPRVAPARRWEVRGPYLQNEHSGPWSGLKKFAMLKWLDPALEKAWDWNATGYLGLAFD